MESRSAGGLSFPSTLRQVLVRSTSISAAFPAARSASSFGSTCSTSLNRVVSAAAAPAANSSSRSPIVPEGGELLVDRCQLPTGSLASLRGPLADALIHTEIKEGREEVLPVGRLVRRKRWNSPWGKSTHVVNCSNRAQATPQPWR